MNESLQQWFDACTSTPGTLGGGMRRPDGSSICRSTDETFPGGKMERVLEVLAQFQPHLVDAAAVPRWSTWQFEQGKIRCVARPDGWLLGVAVRLETEAANQLDNISEAFLALDLSPSTAAT